MLNRALRLIRLFHEMTQTDLAGRLGISKSHLSGIEAGDKTPSLDLLNRYSEAFDVPLSSIMFFAEHVNDEDTSQTARTLVASKVVAIMDFIAHRSGRACAD